MTDQTPPQVGAPIGFAEFVSLVAALLALGALGIDAMLPALPVIGRALGVADPNARRFVISAFLGGFGMAQLFYGPLADRFGRRRVLLESMGVYAASNVLSAVSGSFALLLASRVLGGDDGGGQPVQRAAGDAAGDPADQPWRGDRAGVRRDGRAHVDRLHGRRARGAGLRRLDRAGAAVRPLIRSGGTAPPRPGFGWSNG